VSAGLLIPILPIYAKELNASYGLVGLVLAGQGLGMLLGDVPAGVLQRRLGQKGTMLLGIGCTLASTVALFWANAVYVAVLLRLLSGFGQALWSVSRHAYIADAVRVENRGRAIALFGGTMRIGRFVGPTLGGFVAARAGLRAAFFLFGALYAVTLALVAVAVREVSHADRSHPARAGRQDGHLLAVLRAQLRVLSAAGAGQLFAQAIRAGRSVIIPLYAADVIGLDVDAIGYIVSISSAIDMLLFYPAGWIMDHLGRKRAIVPSFALQALGMLLVPFTGTFAGLVLATTLIGFGNGLGSGSMMTLGADLAPTEGRGEFLGVWRLIGDVGSSGGPLAVGGVADLLTLPMAAWVMCAIGLAAAATFAFLVPETLRTRRVIVEQRSYPLS